MSFFKDFKEDFSQAVNELLPADEGLGGEESLEANADDLLINTLDSVDLQEELDKMTSTFEEQEEKEDAVSSFFNVDREEEPEATETAEVTPEEEAVEEIIEEPAAKITERQQSFAEKEEVRMNEDNNRRTPDFDALFNDDVQPDDEVSTITKGMTISGDIESTGSLNIDGKVNGNVTTRGKIVVTGRLNGNSNAQEFFADSAKVKGEVSATGKVKIGDGSVIVGNITATSAVIAGAVKGDIDVHGPVIVDTTAVVVGNIKSQSVQINNGAVIEGFCSQVYAEIKYDDLFGDTEG